MFSMDLMFIVTELMREIKANKMHFPLICIISESFSAFSLHHMSVSPPTWPLAPLHELIRSVRSVTKFYFCLIRSVLRGLAPHCIASVYRCVYSGMFVSMNQLCRQRFAKLSGLRPPSSFISWPAHTHTESNHFMEWPRIMK